MSEQPDIKEVAAAMQEIEYVLFTVKCGDGLKAGEAESAHRKAQWIMEKYLKPKGAFDERPITLYRNVDTDRMYVEVDGVLHTTTDEGEPLAPIGADVNIVKRREKSLKVQIRYSEHDGDYEVKVWNDATGDWIEELEWVFPNRDDCTQYAKSLINRKEYEGFSVRY